MKVVNQIGVSKIDMTTTFTANGPRQSGVYLVDIHLLNGVVFNGLRVTDGEVHEVDVLIGMDIIGSGDFAVTHKHDRTRMTYQVPSSRDIDFMPKVTSPGRQGFKGAGRQKRKKGRGG